MCFAFDAEPPRPAGAPAPVPGTSLTLTSSDGTSFMAYSALASSPSGASVVILPDIRGLFAFYQRLAENFASVGIDALAIDYFGRTAGISPRDSDFEFRPHVEQTTYEGVAADVLAGASELRSGGRSRALFTVGFCFGGSYSFLLAADPALDHAGAIGFYGGMRPRQEGGPTPITVAPQTRVPVLGLFGGADQGIPADKVAEYEAGLAQAGVEHTVHTYPGAPHSFFDRSYADFSAECADAWDRVLSFIKTHTPAA
jgi:carboxymethylenebutenolidase